MRAPLFICRLPSPVAAVPLPPTLSEAPADPGLAMSINALLLIVSTPTLPAPVPMATLAPESVPPVCWPVMRAVALSMLITPTPPERPTSRLVACIKACELTVSWPFDCGPRPTEIEGSLPLSEISDPAPERVAKPWPPAFVSSRPPIHSDVERESATVDTAPPLSSTFAPAVMLR